MKYDPANTSNIGRTPDGRPIVVDEQVAEGVRGTILDSDLLTPILQEVYNAITMSGLEPSYDNTQLYQVLARLRSDLTSAQNSLASFQQQLASFENNLPSQVTQIVNQQLSGLNSTIQAIKDQASSMQTQLQQEIDGLKSEVNQDIQNALNQLNQAIADAKNEVAQSASSIDTRLASLKSELEGEMEKYVLGSGLTLSSGSSVPSGNTNPGALGSSGADDGQDARSLAYTQTGSATTLGIYTYSPQGDSSTDARKGALDRPVVVDQYPGMVARGRPLALMSDIVSLTAKIAGITASDSSGVSAVINNSYNPGSTLKWAFWDGYYYKSDMDPFGSQSNASHSYSTDNSINSSTAIASGPVGSMWLDGSGATRYTDGTLTEYGTPGGDPYINVLHYHGDVNGYEVKAPYILSGQPKAPMDIAVDAYEEEPGAKNTLSQITQTDQTSTADVMGLGVRLYTGGSGRPLYQDDIGDFHNVNLRTRPLALYSDIAALQSQISSLPSSSGSGSSNTATATSGISFTAYDFDSVESLWTSGIKCQVFTMDASYTQWINITYPEAYPANSFPPIVFVNVVDQGVNAPSVKYTIWNNTSTTGFTMRLTSWDSLSEGGKFQFLVFGAAS